MKLEHLEIRRLSEEWEEKLGTFFEGLRAAGLESFFHPHPLTKETAKGLSRNPGRDEYYVATLGGAVVGYAMLRGWNEGYEIPSAGIAIAPDYSGLGLGSSMVRFLGAVARLRGARRIRCTVEKGNVASLRLFESLGYTFEKDSDKKLIGFLDLSGKPAMEAAYKRG